jgi:hypothetical protein
MGKNSKMWDQINKNSDDIKEVLKQVKISEMEKDKEKFLTKHKDSILVFNSCVSLIVTIIIAFFINSQQLAISESNKILTENNQDLVYNTQVEIGDLSESSSINVKENMTEIKFDFKVIPSKSQGNIKTVYAYIYNNELETFTCLNVSSVNEVKANYSIKGNAEKFKNSVLDMFILYVDYKNNIYYDYVFFIPKYTEHHASQYTKDIDNNEMSDSAIGLQLVKLEHKTINQYELVSKKDYATIVDSYGSFEFMPHDDLLKNVNQVKTYIKQNLV